MNDDPLAYFITWTVYGTWLQGDERGWRRFRGGHETPQPMLSNWRRERLQYDVMLLNDHHRLVVAETIERHCRQRGWKLWVANSRTNHVHAVVSATNCSGARVRDQLKAYCTRLLRVNDARFQKRPVWSRGGDWQCVNSEDDLATVVSYAGEVQDAKDKQ
ncbi:transposase [Stieleria sp. JC731]|uniref:transposase n=1 Tax=Pirellulaceae TaxID=2691357 RepID=UPI001E659C31|nr:transposase [Stieleria sp. JC731]MCC9602503.1 transposase [Stieleria sp. JC731]